MQRIGLLKLDVEGFEGRVLRSLDFGSSLRPRVILFEFVPSLIERAGDSPMAVLEDLRVAGYILSDIRGNPIDPAGSLLEENILAVDARGV